MLNRRSNETWNLFSLSVYRSNAFPTDPFLGQKNKNRNNFQNFQAETLTLLIQGIFLVVKEGAKGLPGFQQVQSWMLDILSNQNSPTNVSHA